PALSVTPGFSCPAGPKRSNFMAFAFLSQTICEVGSEGARREAAVDPQILAGDVAGMGRAQEGAGVAELLGRAETAGGDARVLALAVFLDADAGLLGAEFRGGANAVGVELAGKQVVDGDVPRGHAAR